MTSPHWVAPIGATARRSPNLDVTPSRVALGSPQRKCRPASTRYAVGWAGPNGRSPRSVTRCANRGACP